MKSGRLSGRLDAFGGFEFSGSALAATSRQHITTAYRSSARRLGGEIGPYRQRRKLRRRHNLNISPHFRRIDGPSGRP